MTAPPDTRRYPGAHSFEDSALDRELFFGRSQDAKNLLDTILSEQLVVLYARSGAGKTSLLNAGVKQALRDQNFLPLVARVNDAAAGPLSSVFDGIAQAAREQAVEHNPGSDQSLWHYFKTVEFWRGDSLLVPVLILDQFEELFTLQGVAARERFIEQLADLVRGRRLDPGSRRTEQSGVAVPDSPPVVKVVIAIREDYLTALEELATLIPGILRTRFRLRPLAREEARSAIEDPARVINQGLGTPGFDFTPGTVDALLDLLAAKPSVALSGAATIEPFQLQLVCQYVEDLVRRRDASAPRGAANEGKAEPAIKIDFADLGGAPGFHRIIRQFYERQLDEVGQSFRRRSLERLCERGLVNALGKRLSEEENEIARQFGVPRKALLAMAERRLLRAEPRLDSTFYELSHDMLVEPVLAARSERQRRQAKRRWAGIAAAVLVSIGYLLWWMIVDHYRDVLIQSATNTRERAATDTEKALITAVKAMGKSLNLGGVSQVSTALSAILNQPTVTAATLGDRPILASALAPGGRLVAAATADGRVELRDRGGRLILTLPVGGQGWKPILAFGPDGDTLAVANGSRVQAWDVSGRPITKETNLPEPGTALEFSPAGDMLVVATTSKKLCSVDFRAGSSECSTFEALDGELCQLLFTGSDDRLLGLTREGTVFQWRIEARQFQDFSASFRVTLAPNLPELSADERLSAAIYGSSVLLWQTGAKELRQLRLTDSEGAVPTAVAFSPAGDKLAVGTDKGTVSIFLTSTDMLDRSFDAKVGRIAAIAWTKGDVLAVGGANGVFFSPSPAKPASLQAGAPTLDSDKYPVTALAFLSDGSLLSAGRMGLRLWGTDGVLRAKQDLRDYRSQYLRDYPDRYRGLGHMVRSLASVPRGSLFLVGDDGQDLEVWSVNRDGFKTESHRDPPSDILSIHVDPRGTRVTTIDSHGDQAEWNLTGSELSPGRRRVPTKGATDFTDRVRTLDSDRAGSIFAGTASGSLYLYSPKAESYEMKASLATLHNAPVSRIRYSPAGRVLASTGEDGTLKIVSVLNSDFGRQRDIPVPSGRPEDVAVSPEGNEILLAAKPSKLVRVRLNSPVPPNEFGADHVAVAPRGEFVATLDSNTHRLSIFDPELRRLLYWSSNISDRCEPSAFAIAPDARRIVVGCKAGKLALWTQNGDDLPAPVTLFDTKSEGGSPDEEATSEDVTAVGHFGSFFVCGSSKGRVAIWTENGDKLRDPWPTNEKPDKRTPVTAVAVSPDGNVLVSGTDDGSIDAWQIGQGNMPPKRIWEKRDPRESGVTSLAFEPDGREVLAGFADGTVHQYMEGDGKTASDVLITLNQTSQSAKETRQSVVRVAVSPDGKQILTSGSKGAVQWWNRAGEPLTEQLDVSGGDPVDVAFTSDGLSVITSRADLVGPLLPGSPQEWLANACDRLRYSAALSDGKNPDATAALTACVDRIWGREGSGQDLVAASDSPGLARRTGFWRWLTSLKLSGGSGPLHRAAGAGRIAAVQALINAGADVNARDAEGRTPLAVALRSGYADVAALLLAHKADVMAMDAAGNSTLHDAAAGGLSSAADRLIGLGVPPDRKDQDGVTPLMIAASHGNASLATLLLDHQASIDANDTFGRTPLIIASRAGHPAVVKLLLARHADVNKFDNSGAFYGRNALLWAKVAQRSEVVDLIESVHPTIREELPGTSVRMDLRVLPPSLTWATPRLLGCQAGSLDTGEARQFLQAAEEDSRKGNADAEFLVGLAYTIGCGTTVNAQTAREHFHMAAQRRSALGEAAFGLCLQMGYGGSQDTKAAKQQFRSSAEQNNSFGQWLFALLAPEDEQKDKEHREALAVAAEKFAPAANSAAFDGNETPVAELPKGRGAEISRLYQLSAAAGDVVGMNDLAFWQAHGLREFESSVGLFKKATEAKDQMILWPGLTMQPAAYPNYNLGKAYQFGFGAPQSDAEAFRRYSLASALGHSAASGMLALMYEHGQGVPTSRATAISLYRKAAASGDYYSMERLRALNYAP